MIKLVKGLEYNFKNRTYLKGQEIRLRKDLEEYLVNTGHFDYVGSEKVIYIMPAITTTLRLFGQDWELIERQPLDVQAIVGYEIIRLGFATELPLRKVLIEDIEKLKSTLFIRNGGLGDLVMLYGALKYLMKLKKMDKIFFMTEARYFRIFSDDKRFQLFDLANYPQVAKKFKHALDLRWTVEGDPDTSTKNRMLLFIRLLGLTLNGQKPDSFQEFTELEFKPSSTRYDLVCKENSVIINIGTSRPERDLSREVIIDLVSRLESDPKFNKIIIAHHIPFKHKFNSDKIINLSAQTNLSELMNLIYNCRYYIGLDTGPSHIAGAFAKEGIVIGGPIDMELRYSQYKNLKILQREDLSCVKQEVCYSCHKRGNPNMPGVCMQYTGEAIYNKFLEVI